MLLPLSRSWLGKEDHGLEAALLAELPGILNWSLAGLERLTFTNKNRFTVVTAADEAVTAMRDLASPVGAFVRERCEVGADKKVEDRRALRCLQKMVRRQRAPEVIEAGFWPRPSRRGPVNSARSVGHCSSNSTVRRPFAPGGRRCADTLL